MILDTNALSAWADGDVAIEGVLRSASTMLIPVVVLGEFDFGIRQFAGFAFSFSRWTEKARTRKPASRMT